MSKRLGKRIRGFGEKHMIVLSLRQHKEKMRKLLFFAMSLLFMGCGLSYILLVDPKTRDLKRCSASEVGVYGQPALSRAVESCAKQFEALGYVRAENLTPEQRSNLDNAVPKQ